MTRWRGAHGSAASWLVVRRDVAGLSCAGCASLRRQRHWRTQRHWEALCRSSCAWKARHRGKECVFVVAVAFTRKSKALSLMGYSLDAWFLAHRGVAMAITPRDTAAS